MIKSMNRRDWMKTSLLSAGALVASPSFALPKKAASGAFHYAPESILGEYLPDFPISEPKMLAKLNANENPYGPAPEVVKAIANTAGIGNRYGHGEAKVLIDMIAEKEGVSPDHIMLGPGSTDLLEKVAITRFKDGGNVISADPSYMSLINTAQSMGGSWKPVPLASDYGHDLDAMEKAIDAETKLIYVCNPNNPTGSITDSEKLKAFCSKVSEKTPVFVDEAYLEFLENPESKSMVGLVAEGKDVIVARTFSKIHGMAGLRIGYMVATPERIESVTQYVRSTMGLCVTSLNGAIASMKQNKFLTECRGYNSECRHFTHDAITSLGYDIIPSHTSFMIFPIAMDGKEFMKGMYDSGVGIRVFNINDKDWCRVSMGTKSEMEIFVETFKKVTA
ncbi:pyridoxal phosphate-dependent aminotransferase [Algoriphagus machipongonensis]|uniref:Aminotransferase, classes I and II n=1 Tax=Algoriphagus machipongonensis TaxID=388413 RepID=A3HRU5_9BACT|nr:aminotransferase class I/II-fold pyridoxal phosphate-dependent enzyme [Algoriphagus machipongonensis]EAZ82563.1 aminotransferase, classes I and II [Algoriphagus machipongonensis]